MALPWKSIERSGPWPGTVPSLPAPETPAFGGRDRKRKKRTKDIKKKKKIN